MLPCQRALFDIPREVCFLNAASWSPLPLAVQEAGRAAVGRKGQPWKLESNFQSQQYERARKAAAALIGADSADVALISSVGYGVASGGEAALRAMLASCAPGLVVMNIDNGYGAACAALRILRAIGPA
jgi:selenocysteine lyase/cysteine desulfurase